MGFLLVTAVLVVSLGRVGGMYGRVKMHNLGFRRLHLLFDHAVGDLADRRRAALWIIVMRVFQGVGGAFLFANSSAILTDAFPANERGKAMGINGIAASQRLVPRPRPGWRAGPHRVAARVPRLGAVRAVRHGLGLLEARGQRRPRRPDRLAGQCYLRRWPDRAADGDHLLAPALRWPPDGMDQPVGAPRRFRRPRHSRLCSSSSKPRSPTPMFRLSLFQIRAFTAGNIAGCSVPSVGAASSSC